MSKNIYYENKFYRDSVVNICRCYCELGARYKEYGKAADVHGNRRKTIVARNALCAFAILTIALSIPLSGLETSVRLSFLTLILMSLR